MSPGTLGSFGLVPNWFTDSTNYLKFLSSTFGIFCYDRCDSFVFAQSQKLCRGNPQKRRSKWITLLEVTYTAASENNENDVDGKLSVVHKDVSRFESFNFCTLGKDVFFAMDVGNQGWTFVVSWNLSRKLFARPFVCTCSWSTRSGEIKLEGE